MVPQLSFVRVAIASSVAQSYAQSVQHDVFAEEVSGLVMLQVATKGTTRTIHSNQNHASGVSSTVEVSSTRGKLAGSDHSKLQNPLPIYASGVARTSMLDSKRANSESNTTIGDHGYQAPVGPGMLPELETRCSLSNCFTSSFGCIIVILLIVAVFLVADVVRQMQRKRRLQYQVRNNLAKLHAERRRLRADSEKAQVLEGLKEEEKILMRAIHNRGNVIYDESRYEFVLKKKIIFVPELPDKGWPRPAVVARFADRNAAKAILSDFAELLQIIKGAVVLIEGHTEERASPHQMGDYEHDVADARAELVKAMLIQLGIAEFRITTLGLPGFLGNGADDVVLKMVN